MTQSATTLPSSPNQLIVLVFSIHHTGRQRESNKYPPAVGQQQPKTQIKLASQVNFTSMESSTFALTQLVSKNSSVYECNFAFDAWLPQRGASLLLISVRKRWEGYTACPCSYSLISTVYGTLSPTTAQSPVRDELLCRT